MMASWCRQVARPRRSPNSSSTAIDSCRRLRLGRVSLIVLDHGQLVQAGGAALAVAQFL